MHNQSGSDDGAIVVPIKKLKTKSGKTIDEVLGENLAAPLDSQMEVDFGRDLRIKDGKVLIKFPKFVQLIVTHDFEDVMRKHEDQDIVIPSELLVDLANAHDETPEQFPWSYLILGIVLGIVFAIIASEIIN